MNKEPGFIDNLLNLPDDILDLLIVDLKKLDFIKIELVDKEEDDINIYGTITKEFKTIYDIQYKPYKFNINLTKHKDQNSYRSLITIWREGNENHLEVNLTQTVTTDRINVVKTYMKISHSIL